MPNNRSRPRDRASMSDEGPTSRTSPDDSAPGGPRSFSPQEHPPSASGWEQIEQVRAREAQGAVDEESLYQLVRATMKSRRLRRKYLPGSMFGEPAWEMLLALYIVDRRGARETISSLCLSSGAPASTALRWLDYLEQRNFAARRQSPTDRRVVYIDLTPSGRSHVEAYFAEVGATMLSVPGG